MPKRSDKMDIISLLNFLVICFFSIVPIYCQQTEELSFNVQEQKPAFTYIGQVSRSSSISTKYNETIKRKLRYSFLSQGDSDGSEFFQINSVTSVIETTKIIDRDNLCDLVSSCCSGSSQKCHITLKVAVRPVAYLQFITINVYIKDINDNVPKFPDSELTLKISETAAVNTTFPIPSATDLDSGTNGEISYYIDSPSGTFGLKVQKVDPVITDIAIINIKPLDREKATTYKVRVFAVDSGNPQQTGTVTITVVVLDVNDNRPVFKNSSYSVTVAENIRPNTSIIQVQAEDSDSGANGEIVYSISSRASRKIKQLFDINPKTGFVIVKGNLDFEKTPSYLVTVEAKDKGPGAIAVRTTVTVHVSDVNDNSPDILVNLLTPNGKPEISEAVKDGYFVAHILVQDPDKGNNGKISCNISSPNFKLEFMYVGDENQFQLVTSGQFDNEQTSFYNLVIMCLDKGEPPLWAQKNLNISIVDENDNPPKFTKTSYSASVVENNPIGAYLLSVSATDTDSGQNGRVQYRVSADGSQLVTINQNTGIVHAKISFDRETMGDEIIFHVVAYDEGQKSLSATTSVLLWIKDQNDNIPEFRKKFAFNVTEDAKPKTYVGAVWAQDSDKKSTITYSFAASADASYFRISKSGIIRTDRLLDRENKDAYSLIVRATDGGVPPRTGATDIIIKVLDVNDSPPDIIYPNHFQNTVYISYLEPPGHVVLTVNATDRDVGRNGVIKFKLGGDDKDEPLFAIDEDTGVITVANTLHVSDAFTHQLQVVAMDGGSPPYSSVHSLNIVVDGTGKPISLAGEYLDKGEGLTNLIIVITLAVASAIISAILIIAIIYIRRKDRDGHNYNVRTESQKIVNFNQVPKPKKEVNYLNENDYRNSIRRSVVSDAPLNNYQETPWTSPTHGGALRSQLWACQQRQKEKQYKQRSEPNGQSRPAPQGRELSELLQHPPHDTDSENSLNSSDSGHGTSEMETCLHNKNKGLALPPQNNGQSPGSHCGSCASPSDSNVSGSSSEKRNRFGDERDSFLAPGRAGFSTFKAQDRCASPANLVLSPNTYATPNNNRNYPTHPGGRKQVMFLTPSGSRSGTPVQNNSRPVTPVQNNSRPQTPTRQASEPYRQGTHPGPYRQYSHPGTSRQYTNPERQNSNPGQAQRRSQLVDDSVQSPYFRTISTVPSRNSRDTNDDDDDDDSEGRYEMCV